MPHRVNKDLALRTPGEELWVRRKEAGLTMPKAARAAGLGRTTWWLYESGRKAPPAEVLGPRRAFISLPTLLALARKRSGLGIHRTARTLGPMSHVTLLAREARGDPSLRAAWEGRGFWF